MNAGMQIDVRCPHCKAQIKMSHKALISSKARVVLKCDKCQKNYSSNNLDRAAKSGLELRAE